ncbi:MAG: site-specific integrase [Armatimonadota bacterium]
MFSNIFSHPANRLRHAKRLMATELARYAQRLCEQGYSHGAIWRYLSVWEAFCSWLVVKDITIAQVTDDVVKQFIDERVKSRQWRGKTPDERNLRKVCRSALTILFQGWTTDGYWTPPSIPPVVSSWDEAHIVQYRTYLETHRGLRPSTLAAHLRELHRFLNTLPATSWTDARFFITLSTIEQYILERCDTLIGTGRQVAISMFRGWLHYLFVIGELSHDWSPSLPTYRRWRLAEVPPRLSWDEISRMLASIDQQTAMGKRDYAMLLLVVTYGLRAHEVVGLRLENILWREARIEIRPGKNRHPRVYPLMPDVQTAIIAYLSEGRPASTAREVFLGVRGPHTPIYPASTVYITRKYLRRAGLTPQHWGPHTLRHAYAIHLLEAGCSLKAIGDVLGHRSVESTYIYTKAPYELLRAVALDVTEVWV